MRCIGSVLLVLALDFSGYAQNGKIGDGPAIKTFSEFEASMPPVRYAGNPVIAHAGWSSGQVMEPCILTNPKDTSKLIMFYGGGHLIAEDGGRWAIGKAWADKSDPAVWHEFGDNPIVRPDPRIPFESYFIRMDCVLYHAETDEYWIYYTGGQNEPWTNAVGLAVCATGKDGYSNVTEENIRKYEGNPILSSTGQGREDGTCVSQAAVIWAGDKYYMYYSYRVSNSSDVDILPGIRYATSADGINWTKRGGGNIIGRGRKGSPDSKYFEWKQIFASFGRYILVWEAFDSTTWTACMATAVSPEGPWVKSPANPIFKPSGKAGTFDEKFVATPGFYLINKKWYLFYQGAKDGGNYNYNHWDIGVAELMNRQGQKSRLE
jgi:hypothetical protein